MRPKDEQPADRPPPDDPGNPTVNWHGERRSNATHGSTTDPDAKLARKGPNQAARLCYSAHALRQPGVGRRRCTGGADKAYDVRRFIDPLRRVGVTPHIAQQITAHRGSWVDGRATRHAGYAVSQRVRKRVEEIFGWWKMIGGLRKTRYRGSARVTLHTYLVATAHNLLRLAKLLPAAA